MSDFIRKQGKDPHEIDFLNPEPEPEPEPVESQEAEKPTEPEKTPEPEIKPEGTPETEESKQTENPPDDQPVTSAVESGNSQPPEGAVEEMVSKVLIG